MSFGCTRTKSTTKSRINATELAVDATIDRAGMPSGELGSLSGEHNEMEKKKSECGSQILCMRFCLLTKT